MTRPTTKSNWIAAGTVLAALLAACAPAKTTQKPPERATEKQPYSVTQEGEIPPLAPVEVREEPDVQETPLEDLDIRFEDADPPPPKPVVGDPEPGEKVPGFRVQLFASGAPDVAERARKVAQERLGVPAYVAKVDGLYKVRVGDCKTREAAEALLTRARDGYYKDAWIVETEVVERPSAGE